MGQDAQLAAACPEKDPDGQATQLVAVSEPTFWLKVPAGHARQATVPVLGAYVPAAQFVHWLAPAAEKVPVGHKVH